VLRVEPDFTLLPQNLNPRLYELLRHSLDKDVKHRWQAVGDLRFEIENVLARPAAEQTQATSSPIVIGNARREWVLGSIAVLAVAAFASTLFLWAPWRVAAPAATIRLNSEIGADISVGASSTTLAVSPDGSMLAFVSAKNGTPQIYIRRLGQLQASPLAGTSGALSPFFSPDGQWLAFFAEGKLKKISISGGAAVTLADAPAHRGGSWGDDGYIVFTPNGSTGTSLQRVSSAGGKVESLTKLGEGEGTHRWPQVLPDCESRAVHVEREDRC
jgi:serine/threonine-protein kinase